MATPVVPKPLTGRVRDVAWYLVREGLSRREIAERLDVHDSTVREYFGRLRHRMTRYYGPGVWKQQLFQHASELLDGAARDARDAA